MDQPTGFIRTVVRIVHSDLIRNSDGSYQIDIVLEAQGGGVDVAEIVAYHCANDILQGWKILQLLSPRSIHYVEGAFRWNDEKLTLMGPDYVPYRGDMDLINSIFSNYDEHERTRTLLPETLKIVSGCIKDMLIEKTEDGDAAIIQLAERDEYGLILLPELFETYKGMILGGNYLEYRGIPQDCSIKFANGVDCTSAIIVKTIKTPNLPDEMEDVDNE